MAMVRQMVTFGVVGSVGFAIDAGVVFALTSYGVSPYLARLVSFPLAVLATWWLNRSWTFSEPGAEKAPPRRQLNMYFMLQIVGALANFAVYAMVLPLMPATPIHAVYALAIGSLAGMVINFTGSRFFIFKPTTSPILDQHRGE